MAYDAIGMLRDCNMEEASPSMRVFGLPGFFFSVAIERHYHLNKLSDDKGKCCLLEKKDQHIILDGLHPCWISSYFIWGLGIFPTIKLARVLIWFPSHWELRLVFILIRDQQVQCWYFLLLLFNDFIVSLLRSPPKNGLWIYQSLWVKILIECITQRSY